jgi:hypothetical protein
MELPGERSVQRWIVMILPAGIPLETHSVWQADRIVSTGAEKIGGDAHGDHESTTGELAIGCVDE